MKQSVFGVISLILGILGFLSSCFVFGIVPSVLGIIFAIIGFCQKDRGKGTAIAGLILSIVGTAIAGFSLLFGIALFETDESDTATKTSETGVSESSSTEESISNVFNVGDVVETDYLKITCISANEYTDEYFTPQDGNMYYKVDFEFENISDSDQYVSSYDFECYADSYSAEQTWIQDESLDATLSSGKKVKGSVCFEVPRDAKEITLEYETNFWSESKVIFNVK